MARRARSLRDSLGDDELALTAAELARVPSVEDRRFGLHVRSLRRARGLTQERLAERCGLAVDTIRRLERGLFSPSLDTLTKLCAGLELMRSTLFESFELGERDHVREVIDLLLARSPEEIEWVLRVATTMLDHVDRSTRLDCMSELDEPAAELDEPAA